MDLHLSLEAVHVHFQPLLPGDLGGEFRRKAVGGIQDERFNAADAAGPIIQGLIYLATIGVGQALSERVDRQVYSNGFVRIAGNRRCRCQCGNQCTCLGRIGLGLNQNRNRGLPKLE